MPLLIDNAIFGAFKHELPPKSIISFYSLGMSMNIRLKYRKIKMFNCLGPKNYCISYEDIDGGIKTIVKTRGFYLKNKDSRKLITDETYHDFILGLLKEAKEKEKHIPQFNINVEKKTNKLFSRFNLKTFSNGVYTKRILCKGDDYLVYSLPFGYDENLLIEAKNLIGHIKMPTFNTSY